MKYLILNLLCWSPSLVIAQDSLKQETLPQVIISSKVKHTISNDSIQPMTVLTNAYFRSNPTPNVFDALQYVNGVRPQINCNVCNTGDIRINGLEGSYTMVLMNGMPLMTGLSGVYGFAGIPTNFIEKIEVIKGPSSVLYGYETVGGVINIITTGKNKQNGWTIESVQNTLHANTTSVTYVGNANKHKFFTSLQYHHFQNKLDKNRDDFTDATLIKQGSLIHQWQINRKQKDKVFHLFGRALLEDRWGGDIKWKKKYRGSSDIYAESIYTTRLELMSMYDIPSVSNLRLYAGYAYHHQNSSYGDNNFNAAQQNFTSQLVWNPKWKKQNLLLGAVVQYEGQQDNTELIAERHNWKKGLFAQQLWQMHPKHQMQLGLRYDYHPIHGDIVTPRWSYRWQATPASAIRMNVGKGFRTAALFAEEHALLSGSRKVEISGNLHPEKVWSAQINLITSTPVANGIMTLEVGGWYSFFKHRIHADYDTHPDKIIYQNLDDKMYRWGGNLNIDYINNKGLRLSVGTTIQDVLIKNQPFPLHTEKISAVWIASITLSKKWGLDYTGSVYGKMRLPLLGPLDPRPEYSPIWSLQNIQFNYNACYGINIFFGIKNLLNFRPYKHTPFLIARTHDPFDKEVEFNNEGIPVATLNNPYALSFDPGYTYAPNTGINIFFGLRLYFH